MFVSQLNAAGSAINAGSAKEFLSVRVTSSGLFIGMNTATKSGDE